MAPAVVEPEADAVTLILLPLAVMLGALVSMILTNNVLKLVNLASTSAWAAGKGELGRAVQPLAKFVKAQLEGAVGPLGSVKLSLDHVLLCALLIVGVGVWRNSSRAVAVLQQKQMRPAVDDERKRA